MGDLIAKPQAADAANPRGEPARRWFAILNTLGTLAALLLIFGFFSALAPHSFPTVLTLQTIARQTTIVAVAAMGMTLIIIAGGIDLSVGSMIALVTVVVAKVLQYKIGPWPAAAAGLAAGALCGLLNGAIITALRVVPFIVTLGTLLILRGVAKGLAHEQKIDVDLPLLRGMDQLMATLEVRHRWQLFPVGVWIMIVLVIGTAILLRYTRFGRHCVAVGSNEQTARLCGVPVARVKILVYTLGGLLAGVAGIMQFSRLTVGDPTVAVGIELEVIAAVVIGGGSLAGGEGSPLGSLIGAVIMATIRSGGRHLNWSNWQQEVITGAIIVLAVAVDRFRHRRAAESGD